MPRSLSKRRPLRPPPLAAIIALLVLAARPTFAAAPPPLLGHPVEYVIVTTAALAPAFAPLADWKIRKGVPAAIKTFEDILAEYPIAADDAERVRLFLKDAHAAGARWVVIGGDTDVIPIRYARTTFYIGGDLPTDRYYECLDGNWNADGDAYYGEGSGGSSGPGDDADLVADVYVGRAPVRTPAEAARVVARAIRYERQPAGDYEDTRLFAAEVIFPENWTPGDPFQIDGAQGVESMLPMFDVAGQRVIRLYENWADPMWRPGALPETRSAVLDSMNLGYGFVALVGRGNNAQFSAGPDMLSSADAYALTNAARPFPMWLSSSLVCQPDAETFGEALMRSPTGGAATLVGPAHLQFSSAERSVFQEFMNATHATGELRMGRAFALARAPFVPYSAGDGVYRWTLMTLILFGDPELTIWSRRPVPLVVTHTPSVGPGNPIEVTVLAAGAPLAGARVTLYQAGHVLAMLTTNGSGQASTVPAGAVDGEIAVTVSADDHRPYEGVVLFGAVTATTASLWRSDLSPGRVTLTWDAPGWRAAEAALERRGDGDLAWLAAGRVDPAGEGRIVTVDESVRPGARYVYRLARPGDGETGYSREAVIDVPVAIVRRLSLGPITPNPVESGASVSLALAGGGDARLELFDLAGRVRWSRALAEANAGRFVQFLDGVERLPAGLYLLRLSEGGVARTRRLVVR